MASVVYSTGTIGLTNGSTTVTGSGTAWVGAIRAGWFILIPGEGPLLVQSVNSDTSLTITRNYQGSTRTGVNYDAVAVQGEMAPFVDALQVLLSGFQATVDGAGQGKFADGSQAEPGMRFASDQDTGVRRKGSNAMALVTGGSDRLEINNAGAVLTGKLTGTAVISDQADDAAGLLLTTLGWLGLGSFGASGSSALPDASPDGLGTTGRTGFYGQQDGLAIDGWPDDDDWGVFQLNRGNRPLQMAYRRGGSENLYFRVYPTSAAGAWRRIFPSANLVGTVSESGGAITGAAFEEGNNANGYYARFASGIQICWKAGGIGTPPVAFSDTPVALGANGLIGRWFNV